MQRPLCSLAVICAGCYAEIGLPAPDAAPTLTSRSFFEACDGSGAVPLDGDRFLVFADDDELVRVYARDGQAYPLAATAIALGIEDAARVGGHVFAIGAELSTIALDTYAVATTTTFAADLVDPAAWAAPDAGVLEAIRGGELRAEGLAFAPTIEHPSRLWLGLRSPQIGGRAIAISLLDPVAAMTRARFGEAALLDLGGAGIRGMAWSDAVAAVFIIAGPVDGDPDRYRLHRWSGKPSDPPLAVRDITAPAAGAVAEAIVAYPRSAELQIIFDMSDAMVGAAEAPCRQVATSERSFRDVIVRVD